MKPRPLFACRMRPWIDGSLKGIPMKSRLLFACFSAKSCMPDAPLDRWFSNRNPAETETSLFACRMCPWIGGSLIGLPMKSRPLFACFSAKSDDSFQDSRCSIENSFNCRHFSAKSDDSCRDSRCCIVNPHNCRHFCARSEDSCTLLRSETSKVCKGRHEATLG